MIKITLGIVTALSSFCLALYFDQTLNLASPPLFFAVGFFGSGIGVTLVALGSKQ